VKLLDCSGYDSLGKSTCHLAIPARLNLNLLTVSMLPILITEKPLEVLVQKFLKASVRIEYLIFRHTQHTQKGEEFVVPGSTEASDRRDPLGGVPRIFSKHCSMDTGSGAGMTSYLCVLNKFGGSISVFGPTSTEFNKPE
jgi:hypothetical protein